MALMPVTLALPSRPKPCTIGCVRFESVVPRSSIALSPAATGLMAGMVGCGKAPRSSEPQTPAAGQPTAGGGEGGEG